MNDTSVAKIGELIKSAETIVIVQADNPDGDSIGSALALELILDSLGKNPHLYCAVDIPSYLRYMSGWDRIEAELPNQFDLSIIVDTSTPTLLEKVKEKGDLQKLTKKPNIVLDHHASVEQEIEFATVTINDTSVSSTGELIFNLSRQLDWPLSPDAGENLMTSILGDTQGLSNDLASAQTYRVMAELVELGVHRPKLEEKRRLYNKMPENIFRFKGQLIDRTSFELEGRLAIVRITQQEINNYSPLYNPAPLIQADMLQVEGVAVTVVLKTYDDGRITGSIRSNNGYPVASKLAASLGGGGHPYAAGFKTTDNRTFDTIRAKILEISQELLSSLQSERVD